MRAKSPRRVGQTGPQATPKRVGLDNSPLTLRTARRIARLTQKQLAAKVGVDHSFISLLESGERSICDTGYQTVVAIARALHVEPHELFPVPGDAEKRPA
jgi:transcriptional regulator with XRE-family HTH domain